LTAIVSKDIVCQTRFKIVYKNIKAKNFNSLQSYVRAIWVKTRKQQNWFWGDIIACWIPEPSHRLPKLCYLYLLTFIVFWPHSALRYVSLAHANQLPLSRL